MRSQVTDGVVAPVVRETAIDQEPLRDRVVDRQQLHCGDPQLHEVLHDRFVGETRVGAALIWRNIRMKLGEALDMELVEDGVDIAMAGKGVLTPVESVVDDEAPRDMVGGVERARGRRIGRVVAEHLGAEPDGPRDGLRMRVEQELRTHAPRSPCWIPRTVGAEPIGLPDADIGDEDVPHTGVVLGHRNVTFGSPLIEQAQGDAVGGIGRHREVGSGGSQRGSQRMRASRPDSSISSVIRANV